MSYAALIFSHSITPRLQYIVDFLSHYYGLTFRLTSAEDKYQQSKDSCRINYSYHRISPGEIYMHPHALLYESDIRPVKMECFNAGREGDRFPVFFKDEGDLGYDLFACIFYLITRYEEYLPHRKDSYGRFAYEISAAYRNNFLHLPLVNIWLEDFRSHLSAKNPEFQQRRSTFRLQASYDIDMAWSYRHKGFRRNAGSLLLLLMKARFGKFLYRMRVLRGRAADPYDSYDWMDKLHEKTGIRPLYFFLVAKEKGKYDKNIDVTHPEFRKLVSDLASRYDTGLHPSWASGDHPSLIAREKQILEEITGKQVHASRQHYIRFDLPATYRQLIAAGIKEDHSMGYGSINGFRASVATPYLWYDLKNDAVTELMVYPFCFMDANAYYEEGLSAEKAYRELEQLYLAVRNVGGYMEIIWHNSFLGTDPVFEGWKDMYERFLQKLTSPSVQPNGSPGKLQEA